MSSRSPFRIRKLYPNESKKIEIQENDIYLFDQEQYEIFLKKLYLQINKDDNTISDKLLALWKIVIQGRVFDLNGIFMRDKKYYGPEEMRKGKIKIPSEIGELLTNVSRMNTSSMKWDTFQLSKLFDLHLKELIVDRKDTRNIFTEKIEYFEKSLLGIFFYMNYLQKVNQNVCVPITNTEGLIKGLDTLIRNLEGSTKEEFIQQYLILSNSYDEIIELKEKDRNLYIYRLLFEILLWMGPFLIITKSSYSNKNILQISNTFRKLFEKCLQKNSEYIAIPFLFHLEECPHANILIVDTENKTVERFEPQGTITYTPRFTCPQSFADEELSEFFSEYNYQYLSPKDICPLIGPQEEYEKQKGLRQEEGYCVTWSMIYANLRLENLSESKEIVRNMTNDITKYMMDIFRDRKVEMKSYELIDIYFQDRLNILMKYFQENLDKINHTFGSTLQIDQRSLLL